MHVDLLLKLGRCSSLHFFIVAAVHGWMLMPSRRAAPHARPRPPRSRLRITERCTRHPGALGGHAVGASGAHAGPAAHQVPARRVALEQETAGTTVVVGRPHQIHRGGRRQGERGAGGGGTKTPFLSLLPPLRGGDPRPLRRRVPTPASGCLTQAHGRPRPSHPPPLAGPGQGRSDPREGRGYRPGRAHALSDLTATCRAT